MSTTTRPHPNSHSISPNRFNILRKTHNIPSFVVGIHLLLLLFGFPFSSLLFNFPVNLLHFTSKLFTTHHKAYLLSPPSKLSLYNPTVISPPLFLIVGPKTCFTSLFLPSFPTSTLQSFMQDWESLLLILRLPLCSSVLFGLFAGPPSVALSGVSACEASALQYILLIGSILCIITPSCLWVQLAQSGPSVWSSAR